jgi:3-epi-6-deoxocathasterone 23-monooxygenase
VLVRNIEWFIGVCVSIIVLIISFWWFVMIKKEKNGNKIPKGNSGWPLIGETLEFIASGYSSQPVIFMENRKSM